MVTLHTKTTKSTATNSWINEKPFGILVIPLLTNNSLTYH